MNSLDLAGTILVFNATGHWPQTGVYITAFGGRPIKGDEDLLECLGESALLTYLNPKDKTRQELGHKCIQLGHDWAMHWCNVTLTFFGFRPEVQLAWARDKRFWLSWSERTEHVWSATGSCKDWIRYTNHGDDASFTPTVRQAMREARSCLATMSPYFK